MATRIDSQSTSEYPLYNIGAVSRMTGVSIATLRMWEHRYGFPKSARTAGGHRLYSERDVIRLRWVKAQIDQGMQTAQAIQALRHREDSGEAGMELLPDQQTSLVIDAPDLSAYRHELLSALERRDTATADRVLSQALLSEALGGLVLQVVLPVLNELGQRWQDGRVNVATEHLATNYLRQRLIMWMLSGPPPFPMPPIVLACAPGELHEGSLLILGVLLRRRRWPVAYLGQAVPLPDLAAFVAEMQAPAVVLVAMREETAEALVDWPRYMPAAARDGKPMVGFGGRVFDEQPQWRVRVPGLFLGEGLEDGLDTLDRWLQGQRPQTRGA